MCHVHGERTGDNTLKMSGLVVVVVGVVGVGGQNMVKANEGMEVVGCAGVSRPPRPSRHNRHDCCMFPPIRSKATLLLAMCANMHELRIRTLTAEHWCQSESLQYELKLWTNETTKGGLRLRTFEIRSYMRQILILFFRARAQG